ncbi:endolytic transglycosylase MltG [Bifidobacterium leontopitheci]|uniref:Endolytic murein transglycosylase n=1 Tax=Bifidobacterium leontopitheci TaxID=2650774 RepID=A0A6I1GKD6_9BIFI|nr:endolytic transglycosylase MltG [Bifidobacterium leontopitheci]KAB7791232.1 YceG family protein [Bifidobacterium leontopitheci]
MSDDDLTEFFDDNTHWVDGNGTVTTSQPPKPPKSRREMRRRRTAKRRRTLLATIMTIVIVVVLACGGYFGLKAVRSWRAGNSGESSAVLDYASSEAYGSVEFTVSQGEDSASIAKRLVEQDVVRSVDAFTGVSAGMTLYPGTYQLKKHMSGADVAAILSDQSKAEGFLNVNAGERVSDVIAKAAALSKIDKSEFQKIIDAKGAGILPSEAGGSFEGWLEPGSYNVKSMGSASEILKTIVDKRIAKLDELKVPSGSERERILIIASIAEAEVNSKDYYGKVTRVILNRLDRGMTLGMDSTTAYGLGINGTQLTNAQLKDSSNPYNTRVNKGLTPTPISNPGDDAIAAALNPEQGDWLYFVTVNLSTGETKFTTGTIDQQNAQFEQYVKEYKQNNKNAN